MRRWRVPLAGAGLALLLVVAYLLGFRQPRAEEIATLQAEVDNQHVQQEGLRRDIARLQAAAEDADELEAARARLTQLLPSSLAHSSFLAQLQSAASAARVELVSVTFSDPSVPEDAPASEVPGTVLVTIGLTVVVEGNFFGITELLRLVELDVDRAVLVQSVSFTEAEAGFPLLAGTWAGTAFALLPADHPLILDPDEAQDEPAEAAPEPAEGRTEVTS